MAQEKTEDHFDEVCAELSAPAGSSATGEDVSGASPASKGGAPGQRPAHNLTCIVCGEPFESKRSDAKTCSDACRARKSRRKRDPLIGSRERKVRQGLLKIGPEQLATYPPSRDDRPCDSCLDRATLPKQGGPGLDMLGLPRQLGGSTRGASQPLPWAGNTSSGCEQCGGTGRVSDDSAYYELDAGVRPRVWKPKARTTKCDETPANDALEGERRTMDATAPTLVERLTALEVQFAEQKQLVRETARQVGIDPDNERLSDEALHQFFTEQQDD